MVGYLQPAYCVRYPDTPVPHVAVIHNRGRRRRRGVGYIAARCPGSPCRSGGLALRRGCRGTRSCSPASSDPPAPPGVAVGVRGGRGRTAIEHGIATFGYRVLHVAARITRGVRQVRLRIDATWRWAAIIAATWQKIRTAFG